MTFPLEPQGATRVRAGPGADHRRGGEARAGGVAAQRDPLRRNPRAAGGRQARRGRRHAVPEQWRARSQPHRRGDRPAHSRAACRTPSSERRVLEQEQLEARVAEMPAMERTPYFCSGCPHNTGTRVPEGSIALAGIGCHFMAQWMEREHGGLHPDGRRGRELDRRGALRQDPARLPKRRRRHLLPLRLARACVRPSRPASTSPSRSSTTTPSP